MKLQTIDISRKELDYQDYVKRSAKESDFKTLISDSTLITENGAPRILYIKLDQDKTKFLRQACKNIRYEENTRTNGLKTRSRIFGFSPRNVIRKDYCSATSLAHEAPLEHGVICDFGEQLAEIYKEYFPEIYNTHHDQVQDHNLSEWKINNTPFTSGIVNKNNPLKYHFDAGNIKNVLSNMIVFKKGVSGGFLSCPEFDVGLECQDNTAVLFDGQNILHGVTPLQNGGGYRYSVVYYSLRQMWNCEPLSDEIARYRKVRQDRETARANGSIDLSQLNTKD